MAKRLTDSDKWLNKKRGIHSKYGGRCAYCGCEISIEKMQIDHIVSREEYYRNQASFSFPLDDPTNLNPSCHSCNNYKRNFSLEDFRSEIEQQVNRLRRDRPTFRLAERFGQIQCSPCAVKFYFETING